MKRLIALLLALLLAAPAMAGPESLSETVQTEAARLKGEVVQAQKLAASRPVLKPSPLDSGLVADLQWFGLSASRLSVEIDASGGPTDLRCIFRGMAEETDVQLKATAVAATGIDQARALGRLARMLEDAEEIAPAASKQIAASPARQAAITNCPIDRNY